MSLFAIPYEMIFDDVDDEGDGDLCSPTKLGDSNEHCKGEAAKKHLTKRKKL